MKAYPDYKNSGFEFIGKIPKHWSLISLKYLLQDGNNGIKIGPFGSSLKLEIIKEDGYKVYGQGNVINNDFTWGHRYIDEDKFQELSVYEIHQDDIIITMMGTTGQAKVVPQNIKQGIFDSHIIRVRVNKKTFPQFISMLINDSYYVYNQVKLNSKGSIMEGLNSSIVKAIQIALPPTPEQQAIADFLDRKTAQIDTLIEKKQRQIDLLQEQRTALINHAVTKGLNPDVRMKDSGVEWLGKIPSHWEMTTVRYFYDVKLGKMLDSNKQNGNDLVKPYLRAANIHWNEILLDEVGVNEMEFSESQLERYALQSGDLLITEGGVTVGRSAIWNGELTECYFQNSLNRARPSKHASTKWLYYWMYFVTNNGFIDILADKSTFGHLTNEKLKALPIPIPPISEHDEIIEKLESYEPKMEAQIVLIEKQIVYLQEYRTALISEAVTGKIDVRTETVHEYPAGTM